MNAAGLDAKSDTITGKDLGKALALLGATPEQIAALPEVMSGSMAEKLLTQFGQISNAQNTRQSIENEKRKDREARKTEREAAQEFKTDFFDHTQPVKTRDKIYVQTIATEQDLLIKGADAQNKVVLENLKAKNSLETDLATIEARAKNTAEEQAVTIAAQQGLIEL